MANVFLCNAFSLSMLGRLPTEGRTVRVRPISLEEVKSLLQEGNYVSAVGHPATAEVLSALLGVRVPPNRVAIQLRSGDVLIVFQISVRLAEGQILSAEEVQSLYDQGLASFLEVEVLP